MAATNEDVYPSRLYAVVDKSCDVYPQSVLTSREPDPIYLDTLYGADRGSHDERVMCQGSIGAQEEAAGEVEIPQNGKPQQFKDEAESSWFVNTVPAVDIVITVKAENDETENETSPGPPDEGRPRKLPMQSAFSTTQAVIKPKNTRFSLATMSAFGLHLGPGAVTMADINKRVSAQGMTRVDLKKTRENTAQRLGRLGKSMGAIRRELVEETLEEKCWRKSPLFRQLAGNFRSLYQIAKSATTPHLLCLPPADWRSEDFISYQDIQAHLLMPEGSGSWGSLQYHSLRSDGLSVDIHEASDDDITLRVKSRPPPLYQSCKVVQSERVIKVLSWEAMEGTSIIILWLGSPLLKEKPVRRKRQGADLGTSFLGMSLNLGSTLANIGDQLGASMLNMSVTKASFAASKNSTRPETVAEFRRHLLNLGKRYSGINKVLAAIDEEILIMSTHYFFPPEDLSHLTPAKVCYLYEAFTNDVLKVMGIETKVPDVSLTNVEITIGAKDEENDEQKEIVEQCIHTYLITGLHQMMFDRWLEIHREQEEDFRTLCTQLLDLSWVEWQIPLGFRGSQDRAISMIREIGSLKTPLEMGRVLASITVAVLEDSPSNEVAGVDIASEASADLLLPLLMRTVALAIGGVPDLVPFVTALAYVRDFGCPSMGFSNIAYASASFEAVVEFISSGACLDFCVSEDVELD
eukprot:TRINITY_DN8259_c0_g1_i2.p1 TRINITY_DN8259_c0_g1~~TRINITY_DN8259_c0_g1_i2.p1  ORF type:complete len:691 (+),score=169.79 TRINITY_DN8259_c0_g1_i2:450-2522(+)